VNEEYILKEFERLWDANIKTNHYLSELTDKVMKICEELQKREVE